MPKKVAIPKCSEEDRKALDVWAHSRTLEARLVERAKIITRCLQGESVKQIFRGKEIAKFAVEKCERDPP
ncbi:MAG: hypothetical protein HYU64_04745 [Armatimonadetes bacterium]|nr:hypothetical protein [Armatimonadota bacterium]